MKQYTFKQHTIVENKISHLKHYDENLYLIVYGTRMYKFFLENVFIRFLT